MVIPRGQVVIDDSTVEVLDAGTPPTGVLMTVCSVHDAT